MLAELDEAARVEEERAQTLTSTYRGVVGRMSKQQVDRAAREHSAHCWMCTRGLEGQHNQLSCFVHCVYHSMLTGRDYRDPGLGA